MLTIYNMNYFLATKRVCINTWYKISFIDLPIMFRWQNPCWSSISLGDHSCSWYKSFTNIHWWYVWTPWSSLGKKYYFLEVGFGSDKCYVMKWINKIKLYVGGFEYVEKDTFSDNFEIDIDVFKLSRKYLLGKLCTNKN